jgi:hypothetical protein
MATRQEHLQWCKQRAMEYCNMDDLNQAFTSFISDLGKHEETANHMAIELGTRLFFSGNLRTRQQMEHFIEGTN